MDDDHYLLNDDAKSIKYASLLKCRAIKSDSEREEVTLHIEVKQINRATKS